MPSLVALIPARAGSKRLPHKNTRDFFGKPLIQWTIEAAQQSGLFRSIEVCTDDLTAIPGGLGHSFIVREPVPDDQPDIVWVRHALDLLATAADGLPDAFAILRPTSPFRTADTIRRAWQQFRDDQPCDSLRAVEPVTGGHPLKMWLVDRVGREMKPLLPHWTDYHGVPLYDRAFHSQPTQSLPRCYVQNASLEIAWTKTVFNRGTIAGDRVMPFLTEGYEGFDLNTLADWAHATSLVDRGLVALPALAPEASAASSL